jgi:phenylacetic acid degradation operon negative regulatory protein
MIIAVLGGKATMSETAARPSALINTVYGEFVRRLGGWISIADLIALMAELDVDGPAVRSAISRMKKSEALVQERRTGIGYRLGPSMDPVFDEGDRRIFGHREPARLEDGWVMAVFSVPESERAHRHQLRSRLTWLGFGNVSPGVWLAPARLLPDTERMLRRVGLSEYVHLFTAHYAAFADRAARSATGGTSRPSRRSTPSSPTPGGRSPRNCTSGPTAARCRRSGRTSRC